MRVSVGRRRGAPVSDCFLVPIKRNTGNSIRIAPAMTNASEGFQLPARSRKPVTFAGSVMPDTISPIPKINPAMSAVTICILSSSAEHMAHDKHGDEPGCHEGDGRRQRTHG